MPKAKQFLKEDFRRKKPKKAQVLPETADEFLAAGVDHEEAGEKWRGGDAVKSLRFFGRAIDTYEEGLKKFPQSFDLAYNKARVQYEITQHPRFRSQVQGSMLELLNTALESSRRALSLKQDDTDTLFNTAQVLTSIAEALDDANRPAAELVPYLEEAVELFNQCLTIQEKTFADSQQQPDIDIDNDQDGGVPIPTSEAPPTAQQQHSDQWAQIVEPLTYDSLTDTILAQLESLTLLCSKLVDKNSLSTIEKHTSSLLPKLESYIQNTSSPSADRLAEIALTKANFQASFADAQFRTGLIDFTKYERLAYDAYRNLDLSSSPKGLADKAEAMLNFQSSLRIHTVEANLPQQIIARWGALSQALTALGAAIKLPNVENLARIHLTRGDAELGRYQLRVMTGYPGTVAPEVLLKNAGVFYRGAANQAAVSTNDVEALAVQREAGIKNALVAALAGETQGLQECMARDMETSRAVVEDMLGEGLVELDALVKIGFA